MKCLSKLPYIVVIVAILMCVYIEKTHTIIKVTEEVLVIKNYMIRGDFLTQDRWKTIIELKDGTRLVIQGNKYNAGEQFNYTYKKELVITPSWPLIEQLTRYLKN